MPIALATLYTFTALLARLSNPGNHAIERMLFDHLHVLASITGKAPYNTIPAYHSAVTNLQLGETVAKHKSCNA
jgi:hypothetical protein